MKILEDDGYFCVDNLPVSLLPTFIQLTEDSSEQIERVALGLDIRGGHRSLKEAANVLKKMREDGYRFDILFLEASTPVLVKRYKETRRMHPLAQGGRMDKAIEDERALLTELKKQATYIIDTTTLLIRELKQEIDRIFVEDEKFCNFYLTFVSFGFKYGIPSDADLVFDVRFLPNPFYIEELRPKTGLDIEVSEYVFGFQQTKGYLKRLEDLMTYTLPLYAEEGKAVLVIAVGCTGGHHRSVAVTHALAELIRSQGYQVTENHRDISRGG